VGTVGRIRSGGGAKAYVQSLGLALHEEFKPCGVYVTVLPPGLTDTPVLAKFGGIFVIPNSFRSATIELREKSPETTRSSRRRVSPHRKSRTAISSPV